MDFDKPKVYGDTFISDGLVFQTEHTQTHTHQKFYFSFLVIEQSRANCCRSLTPVEGEEKEATAYKYLTRAVGKEGLVGD